MTEPTEWGAPIPTPNGRPDWLAGKTLCRPRWYNSSEEQRYSSRGAPADCVAGWETVTDILLPADHEAYAVLAYNEAHPDEQPFRVWMGGDEAPADWDGEAYLCRDGGVYLQRGYGWKHGEGCWNATSDWDRVGYRIAQSVEQLPADKGVGALKKTVRQFEAQCLAEQFHETYERLAPQFGYETREDTRAFDPESANGRLMIAVCRELIDRETTPDTVTLPRMTEAEAMAEWDRFSDRIRGFSANRQYAELLYMKDLIRPDPTPFDKFTEAHPDWREMDRDEAVRLALEWGR